MTKSHDTCADSSLGVGVVSEAGSEGHPRLLTQASNAVTFASAFGETLPPLAQVAQLVYAIGPIRVLLAMELAVKIPAVPVHSQAGILHATVCRVDSSTSVADVVRRLIRGYSCVAFCELIRWCLVDDCAHSGRRKTLSYGAKRPNFLCKRALTAPRYR